MCKGASSIYTKSGSTDEDSSRAAFRAVVVEKYCLRNVPVKMLRFSAILVPAFPST